MFYVILLMLFLSVGQSWAFHPQDDCTQALSLAIPSSGVMSTAGASTDATPACSPADPANGVWFTVVGNGTTLRFSTCDNDGSGAHALQVFKGDCSNLICVGGNEATFCHINTFSADVTWCSEPGVTYYIHLGSETSGDVIAYYYLQSLGACNYVGGNCIPEVVFAPIDLTGTCNDRDDCCFTDGADHHYIVTLPYASNWHFRTCGGSQTHIRVGSSFCSQDICSAIDNQGEPIPGCYPSGTCGCQPMTAGQYHVTIETGFDDGDGSTFNLEVFDCNVLNDVSPVEFSSAQQVRCATLQANQTRMLIVRGENLNPERPPVLEILSDCGDSCSIGGVPATWSYDPNGWQFHPGSPNIPGQTEPHWRNVIVGLTPGGLCLVFSHFLPVELSEFAAIGLDSEVRVHWTTASEQDLASFKLYRDEALIASVAATNNATGGHYTYLDRNVENGLTYAYVLYAENMYGELEWLAQTTAMPRANPEIVGGFTLAQNYPNPFNPETTIEFSINEPGYVKLNVYDLSGRTVMSPVDGNLDDGEHSVKLDASSLTSGIYFYRLEHRGLSLAKKMVLLK